MKGPRYSGIVNGNSPTNYSSTANSSNGIANKDGVPFNACPAVSGGLLDKPSPRNVDEFTYNPSTAGAADYTGIECTPRITNYRKPSRKAGRSSEGNTVTYANVSNHAGMTNNSDPNFHSTPHNTVTTNSTSKADNSEMAVNSSVIDQKIIAYQNAIACQNAMVYKNAMSWQNDMACQNAVSNYIAKVGHNTLATHNTMAYQNNTERFNDVAKQDPMANQNAVANPNPIVRHNALLQSSAMANRSAMPNRIVAVNGSPHVHQHAMMNSNVIANQDDVNGYNFSAINRGTINNNASSGSSTRANLIQPRERNYMRSCIIPVGNIAMANSGELSRTTPTMLPSSDTEFEAKDPNRETIAAWLASMEKHLAERVTALANDRQRFRFIFHAHAAKTPLRTIADAEAGEIYGEKISLLVYRNQIDWLWQHHVTKVTILETVLQTYKMSIESVLQMYELPVELGWTVQRVSTLLKNARGLRESYKDETSLIDHILEHKEYPIASASEMLESMGYSSSPVPPISEVQSPSHGAASPESQCQFDELWLMGIQRQTSEGLEYPTYEPDFMGLTPTPSPTSDPAPSPAL